MLVVVVALIGCSTPAPSGDLVNTPVLDDFRKVERATLQTFNDALGRQRANAIDELGLAEVIDRDVLPPWRELRTRVASATIPPPDRDLFITLGRYVAERQTSWEAYSAALRSHDDASAQPHYATYHQQDVAATNDAKVLGRAFRSLP